MDLNHSRGSSLHRHFGCCSDCVFYDVLVVVLLLEDTSELIVSQVQIVCFGSDIAPPATDLFHLLCHHFSLSKTLHRLENPTEVQFLTSL